MSEKRIVRPPKADAERCDTSALDLNDAVDFRAH